MIDIKVPAVGESISEVTLVKWLKKDGDYVDRDEVIAENRLPRKGRHKFADHTHRRQDHDVHSRVRVKPKQVLPKNRLAAAGSHGGVVDD